MSFYIAWSVPHIIIAFCIIGVISASVARVTKTAYGVYTLIVLSVVIAMMAINVGHRQAELGRSSFDADKPVRVERVTSDRLTRDDATSKLHETIKTQRNSN